VSTVWSPARCTCGLNCSWIWSSSTAVAWLPQSALHWTCTIPPTAQSSNDAILKRRDPQTARSSNSAILKWEDPWIARSFEHTIPSFSRILSWYPANSGLTVGYLIRVSWGTCSGPNFSEKDFLTFRLVQGFKSVLPNVGGQEEYRTRPLPNLQVC